MLKKFREVLTRWKDSSLNRGELDFILSSPPAEKAALRKRTEWFVDLLQWVKTQGLLEVNWSKSRGHIQATRIKYILQVLNRNPEWKSRVATTLRSLIRDTRALKLFLTVGVPVQEGFLAEAIERLSAKVLPQAPDDHDLAQVFTISFKRESDADWVSYLDTKTFAELVQLFQFDEKQSAPDWNSLVHDLRETLLLLSIQIKATGLSPSIMTRLPPLPFRELSFYQLEAITTELISEADPEKQKILAVKHQQVAEGCLKSIQDVYAHLEDYGVNVSIVYHLERMDSQLRRSETLAKLLIGHAQDPQLISQFFANLIRDNIRRHSFRALLGENFSMLSRKISERSAETGEHYITRNKAEYAQIIHRSLGGGFVLAFTAIVKFLIYKIKQNLFFSGLMASLNYSTAFVFIQLVGFTVATKQPAMTATALAAKMHRVFDNRALTGLTDEIIHLVRSQLAAALGNVFMVIPTMFLFDSIFWLVARHHFITRDEAHHVLKIHSVLGFTPLYAAFTGILLWFSSICAGWIDNWSALRRIPAALSHNRRLVYVFGETTAKKIGFFYKRNISGFAGNISLGFLLGMVPVVLAFFGIPIEVRHVTLVSGNIAAAVVALGPDVFLTSDFWLAALGIVTVGLLNIFVAFSLAMLIAIRARNVQAPQRSLIYRSFWKRFRAKPSVLFLPET